MHRESFLKFQESVLEGRFPFHWSFDSFRPEIDQWMREKKVNRSAPQPYLGAVLEKLFEWQEMRNLRKKVFLHPENGIWYSGFFFRDALALAFLRKQGVRLERDTLSYYVQEQKEGAMPYAIKPAPGMFSTNTYSIWGILD